jgi:hypothetical protein
VAGPLKKVAFWVEDAIEDPLLILTIFLQDCRQSQQKLL